MFLDAIASQELSLGVISLPLSCQSQVGSVIQIVLGCFGLDTDQNMQQELDN